jgi:hypothetical protein
VVQVKGGLLAFKVGIGCQNNFNYSTIRKAAGEFFDSDIASAHAFGWRDGAMEHVVESPVDAGMLYSQNVLWLFNHAYLAMVPPVIAADGAGVRVGDVKAGRAEGNLLSYRHYCLSQFHSLLLWGTQQVVGEALGAFSSDTRQLAQFLNESGNGIGRGCMVLVQ